MVRFCAALLCATSALVDAGCDAGEINGGAQGGNQNGAFDSGSGTGSTDSGAAMPVDGEPSGLAGITAAHNQVRSAHGVADITWDNELAAIAKAWADQCEWGHNDARSDDYPVYVGENIFGASFMPSGPEVTAVWASEESDYDYESNSCSGICGHYTQIVWADSTKLGCAAASCPGGAVTNMVVCNYAPGGNIGGQRPY